PANRLVGAQAVHREMRVPGEERRQPPAVLEDTLEGRPDQKSERLAPAPPAPGPPPVSRPEPVSVPLSKVGAPEEPPHDEPDRKIEPGHRLGAFEHELTDHLVVCAVGDPAVALGRGGDSRTELLAGARLPVRAVV